MSGMKFPLEPAGDVFMGIDKVNQEKVDPRAASTKSILPENPGIFYTKMTYQRGHDQHKLWVNRKKVKNEHRLLKPTTHGAKFASLPTLIGGISKDGSMGTTLSSKQSTLVDDSQREEKLKKSMKTVLPKINKLNKGVSKWKSYSEVTSTTEDFTELSIISSDDEDAQENELLKTYSKYQLYYKENNDKTGADSIRSVHRQIDTYHLDLRYIRISHLELKSIFLTVMGCPMISRLDLTEVHIDDTKALYISELFKEHHLITDLILKGCRLGYRQLKRILETLRDRDNVVYLDVSDNNLKDDSAYVLARYIDGATALMYILMARNAFGEIGGKYFGSALGQNYYLRYIDLSRNQFRGEGGRFLLTGLARNTILESIDISWNTFRESGAGVIRRILESPELKSLDITGTGMNSKCMPHIITALKKNSSLEYLGLRNNPFLIQDYTIMLEAIYKNVDSRLMVIDLGNQTLSMKAMEIAKYLSHNRLMDVLHGCQLETKGFQLGDQVSLMKINMTLSSINKLKPDKRVAIANYFQLVDQNQIQDPKPQHLKEIVRDCTFNVQAERGVISFRAFALRLLMAGDNPDRTIEDAEKEIGALSLATAPNINVIKSEPDFFAIRDVELKTNYRTDLENFASATAKEPEVVQFDDPEDESNAKS